MRCKEPISEAEPQATMGRLHLIGLICGSGLRYELRPFNLGVSKKFTMNPLATGIPLLLDTPGLFYVEARSRIARGKKGLTQVLAELQKHIVRADKARALSEAEADDAWADLIRQVGRMETLFGSTVNDFMVGDVLLVASAEAYINAIAFHALPRAEAQQFDKLSPVGKWLILPKMMKLKWKPSLAAGSLQEFAVVTARRNRVVHPKPITVESTAAVASFVQQLKLDSRAADAGVNAIKDMFQQFSLAWRGSYGPNWLDPKKSRNRPPCFIFGGVELGARLGRERRGRDDA